jgi:hypothetical protein
VTVARFKHTVNSDGNSVITLTLNGWDKTIATGLSVKVENAQSENAYGETIEDFDEVVVDKAAPEVEKVVYINETTIEVRLTEEIKSNTVAVGKNGFSVSGGKAKLTSAALKEENSVIDASVIVLTGENFRTSTDVSYNDVVGLADEGGNALKSFSKTDKLDED